MLTKEEVLHMGYVVAKQLPDGTWIAVVPMSFGKGRLCSAISWSGYEDGWCYEKLEQAVVAMFEWDPDDTEEPDGWIRHISTGRRRPDGRASSEFVMR